MLQAGCFTCCMRAMTKHTVPGDFTDASAPYFVRNAHFEIQQNVSRAVYPLHISCIVVDCISHQNISSSSQNTTCRRWHAGLYMWNSPARWCMPKWCVSALQNSPSLGLCSDHSRLRTPGCTRCGAAGEASAWSWDPKDLPTGQNRGHRSVEIVCKSQQAFAPRASGLES